MSFIKGSSRFGLGIGAPACVVLAVLLVSHEILRDDPVKLYRVIPARGQEEEQQLDDEVDRAVREGDLGSGDGLISRDGSDDMRGTLRERRIRVVCDHDDGGVRILGRVEYVDEALRVSGRRNDEQNVILLEAGCDGDHGFGGTGAKRSDSNLRELERRVYAHVNRVADARDQDEVGVVEQIDDCRKVIGVNERGGLGELLDLVRQDVLDGASTSSRVILPSVAFSSPDALLMDMPSARRMSE